MSFSKTKLLVSFAFLGFLIGTSIYLLYNWLFVNSALGISPVPILQVIYAPWFQSGIAGAFLAVIFVYLWARSRSEY